MRSSVIDIILVYTINMLASEHMLEVHTTIQTNLAVGSNQELPHLVSNCDESCRLSFQVYQSQSRRKSYRSSEGKHA